jgi:F420-dependent oxidoreductase-like protein
MRIGLMLDVDKPLDDVVAQVQAAREAGVGSVWCSQIFGLDALTLLAIVGREVPGIGLGTAVVPVQPRHPIVLAGQALTTQAAVGERLTLGIGLSHQVVIEGVFGLTFDQPALRMREYLSVLVPLLAGEQVAFQGKTLRASTIGPLGVVAPAPPVLVAALGPAMLRVAGHLAAGTVTWMTGPATVESHIVPTITAAASAAGRSAPKVVVGLPVCVTDDAAAARELVAKVFAIYGQLPSYRAMLDREGAAGPADVAIVGDESQVRGALERLAAGGATDFVGAIAATGKERERTLELLGELGRR